jgi:hypothetical protein
MAQVPGLYCTMAITRSSNSYSCLSGHFGGSSPFSNCPMKCGSYSWMGGVGLPRGVRICRTFTEVAVARVMSRVLHVIAKIPYQGRLLICPTDLYSLSSRRHAKERTSQSVIEVIISICKKRSTTDRPLPEES